MDTIKISKTIEERYNSLVAELDAISGIDYIVTIQVRKEVDARYEGNFYANEDSSNWNASWC